MIAGDAARVTTFVAVEPEVAFEVFTDEIDVWWRTGPAYRISGGTLRFEDRKRLIEIDGTGGVFEIGRVLAWEPGSRLVFEWRGHNFAPGELTEVEVSFTGSAGGTRVVLEHRGWASLRPDHPVRHGLDAAAALGMIGTWWGGLATSFRLHLADRS